MALRSYHQLLQADDPGAIHDDALIHHLGTEIIRQFNRIGAHVNFAPVADINNCPSNTAFPA